MKPLHMSPANRGSLTRIWNGIGSWFHAYSFTSGREAPESTKPLGPYSLLLPYRPPHVR